MGCPTSPLHVLGWLQGRGRRCCIFFLDEARGGAMSIDISLHFHRGSSYRNQH